MKRFNAAMTMVCLLTGMFIAGCGGDDGGGGGGGGCDAFGGQATGTLALFGLLGLTLTLRRRRT